MPSVNNAHTRIPHSVLDALILYKFTQRQRKIIDLIIRLSWGCGKDEAYIPKQRDLVPILGMAETHISSELKRMKASGVLNVRDEFYSIAPQTSWNISKVFPFEPDKLTKLVSLNLKNTYQKGKSIQITDIDITSFTPEDFTDINADPDRKFLVASQAYTYYFGKLIDSEAITDQLSFYCQERPIEHILKAFEIAHSNEAKKLSYVDGIFNRWGDAGPPDDSPPSESGDRFEVMR